MYEAQTRARAEARAGERLQQLYFLKGHNSISKSVDNFVKDKII